MLEYTYQPDEELHQRFRGALPAGAARSEAEKVELIYTDDFTPGFSNGSGFPVYEVFFRIGRRRKIALQDLLPGCVEDFSSDPKIQEELHRDTSPIEWGFRDCNGTIWLQTQGRGLTSHEAEQKPYELWHSLK